MWRKRSACCILSVRKGCWKGGCWGGGRRVGGWMIIWSRLGRGGCGCGRLESVCVWKNVDWTYRNRPPFHWDSLHVSRFATFRDTSYPVIEAFETRGKVKKVSTV